MSESLYVFKVIIAGDSGVGKTAAVSRFVDGRFVSNTKSTIGVDFSLKNVNIDVDSQKEAQIALQIWDVAGESRFRSILPYYIAGTQGLILAFDGSAPPTLDRLNEWLEVIGLYLSEKIPMILISTKNDLSPNINHDAIKSFMGKHDIINYFATSSLSGENINTAFRSLTELIAKSKGLS
ncbi:MAG: Transforming protein p29 precursor [Candidatus Heimdallarchaeota archaeon LC_3]|nr:MAG: Transforming protein p29 precursor [Candidatus Heimdallarchaeota archaeon LC_3]